MVFNLLEVLYRDIEEYVIEISFIDVREFNGFKSCLTLNGYIGKRYVRDTYVITINSNYFDFIGTEEDEKILITKLNREEVYHLLIEGVESIYR